MRIRRIIEWPCQVVAVAFIAVILSGVVCGCGAPQLTRDWANRAGTGLEIEARNTAALIDKLGKVHGLARDAELAALTGAVEKAKKMTPADWKGFRDRVVAHVELRIKTAKDLSDASAVAARNREEIRKCLVGMVRAAEAWGEKEEVRARLDQLQGMIQSVIEAQRKGE